MIRTKKPESYSTPCIALILRGSLTKPTSSWRTHTMMQNRQRRANFVRWRTTGGRLRQLSYKLPLTNTISEPSTKDSAIYGPHTNSAIPICDIDGMLITDQPKILDRWAQHFTSVLNQQSEFYQDVLSEIPQWPCAEEMDLPPSYNEIQHAIDQLSSGKAPGIDGVPVEILKHGSSTLLTQLTELFNKI